MQGSGGPWARGHVKMQGSGEGLELHRRMAGVVETSWSLGDIDRAAKEMSTPQDPILAGAMEAPMPRGDYWAGLYTTRSPRCTCDRRPRSPFCARSCAGIGKNVWIRAPPTETFKCENVAA